MPLPLIPVLLAGAVAAYAITRKPSPNKSGTTDQKAGLPGGGPAASTLPGANAVTVPTDILQSIAAALKTANPSTMRTVADEIEKAGYAAQAADLRAAALAVEKATVSSSPGQPGRPVIDTTGTTVPPVPSIILPEMTITPGDMSDPTTEPRYAAGQLALYLSSTPRFKEDKTKVAAYQKNNLASVQAAHTALKKSGKATVDGLYGTSTALSLARSYGIVPPAPFYYPTNPTPAKNAYKAELLKFAKADPQRADEWTHAASSVTNM